MLEPANSGELGVANLGHPGLGFGLIGGLIAAADSSSMTTELTAIAKQRSLDFPAEYQSVVVKALEKAGYAVKTLKAQRETATGFLESYDKLDPSVDAYMDIGVSCGYLAASSAADYIPTVRSGVRLVKRSTKEVVYQDVVAYGYENRAGKAVSIPADAKYHFKDFAAIRLNADAAIIGLRAGFPLVANQIANDIRRTKSEIVVTKTELNLTASPKVTEKTKSADPIEKGDGTSGIADQRTVAPSPATPAPAASTASVAAVAGAPETSIIQYQQAAPRNDDATVQKIEFQTGASSITVERLATQHGCTGGRGAGLITDKGPVEVYRMSCDNGAVFLAKCELRQCRPMN